MPNSNNFDFVLNNPLKSWKHILKQCIASCIVHLLVIQAGINMAFSAVLLPQLKEEEGDFNITRNQQSWIASLVTLSTPCGAFLTGYLMDRFGRKNICLFTTLPFIIAWLVHANAKNIWSIYLSRILAGFGGGLSTVGIVYVSEITHPSLRAMLLNLNSVFVSLGILLVCVFGFWFKWRILCYIFLGLILVTLIFLTMVPESPHWLCTFRNNPSATSKSLRWLYGTSELLDKQSESFIKRSNVTNESLKEFITNDLLQPATYRPLVLLIFIFIFQQFSGAYAIIFFAVEIFEKIGGQFGKHLDAYGALVLLGTIRFLISLLSAVCSKRVDRRILLFMSGGGMSISSLVIGLYKLNSDNVNTKYLLAFLLMYVCFSSLGYLVIPWTLIGELLPVKARGKLGGFVVALAYLIMTVVIKTFPFILDVLRIEYLFCIFAFVNSCGMVFIYLFIPETRNKSFEEIEKMFSNGKFVFGK